MAPATVRAAAMNGWESFLEDTLAAPMVGDGPPPESMPLAEFVRFSEDVVTRTRDVAIPWLAGGNYDLAALGPLGDAINSAAVSYTHLTLQTNRDVYLSVVDDSFTNQTRTTLVMIPTRVCAVD